MSLDVAFLIDRWDPARGGAERALADLARRLVERGHRVRAICAAAAAGAPGDVELVRAPLRLSRGARERALGDALVAAAERAGAQLLIGVRHLPRVDLLWPHGGVHAVTLAAVREARAWSPRRTSTPGASVPELGARSERGWRDGPDHASGAADPRVGADASISAESTATRSSGAIATALRGRHRVFAELEHGLLERGSARTVACVSRLVRDEIERAYPSSTPRLFLAENGVDLERFHPRERQRSGAALRRALEIDPRAPLLVFCGRNPVLKGLPVLLHALAGLVARPWTLLVAGPKDARAWGVAARRAGIPAERVRALPHVDGAALAAAADLAVVPTWRDPCLLVVLEALAAGTPVVTTTRAGAADLVARPSRGAVVAPGDALGLRGAIEEQLDAVTRGVDRDDVRSAVLARGADAWLAGLEAHLVELAARD